MTEEKEVKEEKPVAKAAVTEEITPEDAIALARENARLYNESVNNIFDEAVEELTRLIGDRVPSDDERRGFTALQNSRQWFLT